MTKESTNLSISQFQISSNIRETTVALAQTATLLIKDKIPNSILLKQKAASVLKISDPKSYLESHQMQHSTLNTEDSVRDSIDISKRQSQNTLFSSSKEYYNDMTYISIRHSSFQTEKKQPGQAIDISDISRHFSGKIYNRAYPEVNVSQSVRPSLGSSSQSYPEYRSSSQNFIDI